MTKSVLTLLKLKGYDVTINICHFCKSGGDNWWNDSTSRLSRNDVMSAS